MARAIIIVKMKQTGDDRGKPDAPQDVSFVHLGNVELPGNYKAMIVTGTGADLLSLATRPEFLIGQQIGQDGDVTSWADARKAAAPDAITRINNWLSSHGHDTLSGENSIVDLLKIFDPTIESHIGASNVHDAYAG